MSAPFWRGGSSQIALPHVAHHPAPFQFRGHWHQQVLLQLLQQELRNHPYLPQPNCGGAIRLPVIAAEEQIARLERALSFDARGLAYPARDMINEDIETEETILASLKKAIFDQQVELNLIRQQQQLQRQNREVTHLNGAYHPNFSTATARSLLSSVSVASPLAATEHQPATLPVSISSLGNASFARAQMLAQSRQPLTGVYNTFNQSSLTNDVNHLAAATNQFHVNSLHQRSGNGCYRPFNCGNSGYRHKTRSLPSLDYESGAKSSYDENGGMSSRQVREVGHPIVEWIAEWEFPTGTEDKHDYIMSSLRRGIDAKVIRDETAVVAPPRNKRKKKKESQNFDQNDNIIVAPVVTGVTFDSRFLQYERAPGGKLKKDKLVKRSVSKAIVEGDDRDNLAGMAPEHCLQEIQDEPLRSKTASRVGPLYQALLPDLSDGENRCTELDHAQEYNPVKIWDPKLAADAERRGEDIEGFLVGEHELCKKELLLKILHDNDYNVGAAKARYAAVTDLCGDPSSRFTRKEARQFEAILKTEGKDFSSVARQLKRKRSECMIHYYSWKNASCNYSKMKQDWKAEWCCICDDGGDLIICDECNLAYHPKCISPPLTQIPKGNWYCPACRGAKKKAGFSPISPLASGKKARAERKGRSKIDASDNSEMENDNGNSKKSIQEVLFATGTDTRTSQHASTPNVLGSTILDDVQSTLRKPSVGFDHCLDDKSSLGRNEGNDAPPKTTFP